MAEGALQITLLRHQRQRRFTSNLGSACRRRGSQLGDYLLGLRQLGPQADALLGVGGQGAGGRAHNFAHGLQAGGEEVGRRGKGGRGLSVMTQ